jgi:hypothetical protein
MPCSACVHGTFVQLADYGEELVLGCWISHAVLSEPQGSREPAEAGRLLACASAASVSRLRISAGPSWDPDARHVDKEISNDQILGSFWYCNRLHAHWLGHNVSEPRLLNTRCDGSSPRGGKRRLGDRCPVPAHLPLALLGPMVEPAVR